MPTPSTLVMFQSPRHSTLEGDDIEHALRRMKQNLALLDLRRQLLSPSVDGPTVLNVVERMIEIQRSAA